MNPQLLVLHWDAAARVKKNYAISRPPKLTLVNLLKMAHFRGAGALCTRLNSAFVSKIFREKGIKHSRWWDYYFKAVKRLIWAWLFSVTVCSCTATATATRLRIANTQKRKNTRGKKVNAIIQAHAPRCLHKKYAHWHTETHLRITRGSQFPSWGGGGWQDSWGPRIISRKILFFFMPDLRNQWELGGSWQKKYSLFYTYASALSLSHTHTHTHNQMRHNPLACCVALWTEAKEQIENTTRHTCAGLLE